jgi:hypothetical protein
MTGQARARGRKLDFSLFLAPSSNESNIFIFMCTTPQLRYDGSPVLKSLSSLATPAQVTRIVEVVLWGITHVGKRYGKDARTEWTYECHPVSDRVILLPRE